MTLLAACGWTLLRSAALALLAWPLARNCKLAIANCKLQNNDAIRPLSIFNLQWAIFNLQFPLLVLPFLFPELLVGYAYASFSPALVHHPVWNELLFDLLLFARIVPVGAVALHFAPPSPLSAEAFHCRRLAFRRAEGALRQALSLAGFALHGPLRSAFPAVALMFLLAFQDFELASLMNVTSWTVWLFDAQAGGLPLADSLRLAVVPLIAEAAVLGPALWLALRSHRLPAGEDLECGGLTPLWRSLSVSGKLMPGMLEDTGEKKRHAKRRRVAALQRLAGPWFYLAAAVVWACIAPLALVGRGLPDGLGALFADRTKLAGLAREIATGSGFAFVSTLVAAALACWLLDSRGPPANRRIRAVGANCLSIPGCCGSLILGLGLLGLFQRPLLNALYDTPLPLLVALTLFLLPRALLLRLILDAARPREMRHAAALLEESPDAAQRDAGRELRWQIVGSGRFWAAALLGYWAYLDLTAAALLAPVGMVSAPVRLYNLMHYGRNHVLSAMTLVTVAAPVLCVLLFAALRRPVHRWLNP